MFTFWFSWIPGISWTCSSDKDKIFQTIKKIFTGCAEPLKTVLPQMVVMVFRNICYIFQASLTTITIKLSEVQEYKILYLQHQNHILDCKKQSRIDKHFKISFWRWSRNDEILRILFAIPRFTYFLKAIPTCSALWNAALPSKMKCRVLSNVHV